MNKRTYQVQFDFYPFYVQYHSSNCYVHRKVGSPCLTDAIILIFPPETCAFATVLIANF